MSDQVIYENAISSSSQFSTGPTSKRIILDIPDNTQGDYSLAEAIFETGPIANSGFWNDHYNAYIDVPLVLSLEGTNFNAFSGGDLALAMKSSNYNLIHSWQVDAGSSIYKSTDYVNHFVNYELNTKMDLNDEAVNGATIGYYKSSSTSWGYANLITEVGHGLYNNVNLPNYHNSSGASQLHNNSGLFDSQKRYISMAQTSKTALLGNNIAQYKTTGFKTIQNDATSKKYYFNAVLRLRDLPFFQHFRELTRSTNFKITIRFNTCNFIVTKSAAGALSFNQANFTSRGGTNPVMFCASSVAPVHATSTEETADAAAVNAAKLATGTTTAVYACGSKALPINTGYTVSLKIGGDAVGAIRRTCRLFIPSYELQPSVEQELLNMAPRKITYTQLYLKVLKNMTGSVQELLSNGISRATRLVIMPFLSRANNQNIDHMLSPFMDSQLCPHIISNINLKYAGEPIYKSNVDYNYQMFLNEIVQSGHNENQEMGLVSSRISMDDYANTYGYIVFDLRRRNIAEKDVKKSLEFTCDILSPTHLDFYCYVEYETDVTLDMKTGELR